MSQLLQQKNSGVILALCTTPIVLLILRRMSHDYRNWRGLGAGGLPYNLTGWLFSHFVRIAFAFRPNEVQSTTGYEKVGETASQQDSTFLNELPQRKGGRPAVGWWAAPHRQLEHASNDSVRKVQQQAFDALAAEQASNVEVKTSGLERHGRALYVKHIPPHLQRTSGEFAHGHFDAEGSSHVILSKADAEKVLTQGWGERHKLSPCVAIPAGYLLIYAPRNKDEVEVVDDIMRASAKFALLP